MPRGRPKGEKRAADAIGNAIMIDRIVGGGLRTYIRCMRIDDQPSR